MKLISRTATVRNGIARVALGCTGGTACTGKLTATIPGRRSSVISGRYAIAPSAALQSAAILAAAVSWLLVAAAVVGVAVRFRRSATARAAGAAVLVLGVSGLVSSWLDYPIA